MDAPKLGVSWLESFPPDIWAYIVWYLPGEQLGRLMMTGATLMWQRLKSVHVVKSIKLGEDYLEFKSFPKFLNELPSLDELLIHSPVGEWSCNMGLMIELIPSGLRKLELSGSWSEEPNLFGASSNLSKHLPHLTTLDLSVLSDRQNPWMPYSPESLTSLRLNHWDGSVALPSSLIHFEAHKVVLSTSSTLPHSLESFVTFTLEGVDLLMPLLPPSTRKLRLGGNPSFSTGGKSWSTLLEQLPKFLSSFVLQWSFEVSFGTNPELASLLPSTLTELNTRWDFPCSVWHLLPPNLTTLSFETPKFLPTVIIVDALGVQHEVESLPFDLLPRSITKLDVIPFGGERLCGPPKSSNRSYFPPNLTYLGLLSLHLHPEAVKLLPSSLTHLKIPNLCEQVCEYLPTGLKTLTSTYGTLMSPNFTKLLPQTITHLRLSICPASRDWFDYNTGQSVDSVSLLPEYSIHEKCVSNNFDWNQSSPLPSTLITLEILLPNELGDSFIRRQQLPNLLHLSISDSLSITDISVPLIPRHLTTIDIRCSSRVSGKSFEFLPRCLIELILTRSESIFDSDIQHLPRTLKRVNLHHAIHLTDLCIADLPPHLEKLDMSCNSTITPSSFPSFPYTLRSHKLYEAVSFKNWRTSWGKICKRN